MAQGVTGADDQLAFLEGWQRSGLGEWTLSRPRLSRPWVTLASAEIEQIKRPRREGDGQVEEGLGELPHGYFSPQVQVLGSLRERRVRGAVCRVRRGEPTGVCCLQSPSLHP